MTKEKSARNQPRFVSAEQVARKAGVSRSAVSRTFTPGASVSPATREKVLKAAEELGYHVNDLARGILANQSRLVGIVATKPEVGFRSHLTAALSKALIARGSVPVLINTGQTEEELLAAQRILIGHRAAATIILSGSPPASFFELARRNGQPVVMIGRGEAGADLVQAGNQEAASRAAELFIEAGRKKLAYIGSHSGTPSIREREIAFAQACQAHGLGPIPMAHGADSDYQGGVTAARELLEAKAEFDAIFCANDLLALGLIDILRRAGLRVPQDVAVMAFDDVPEAAWLNYSLTTFRQDPQQVASAVITLLEQRALNADAPSQIVRIIPDLVVRESFIPTR
ncbi:LacI family DNA-binding transcriptional regulator [Rhizobium helianthi]|uniref:LacI family DNA-binding transcriptional regulator n=1 Tax=Rhizobium helianthi TaxID=1132695 RepID=A0ABW4M3H0_9HYPH